jgi:hypothetical protein
VPYIPRPGAWQSPVRHEIGQNRDKRQTAPQTHEKQAPDPIARVKNTLKIPHGIGCPQGVVLPNRKTQPMDANPPYNRLHHCNKTEILRLTVAVFA